MLHFVFIIFFPKSGDGSQEELDSSLPQEYISAKNTQAASDDSAFHTDISYVTSHLLQRVINHSHLKLRRHQFSENQLRNKI